MNLTNHSHLTVFSNSVMCKGVWTVQCIEKLLPHIDQFAKPIGDVVVLDGSAIKRMDSSGAWTLNKIINHLEQNSKVDLKGFRSSHLKLLALVKKALTTQQFSPRPKRLNIFAQIGKEFYHKLKILHVFLDFLGEAFWITIQVFRHPTRFSFRHVFAVVYETGVTAMPIVALLLFLIGIVLSYQMGLQLEPYGANILIVQGTGMLILRWFGTLITAIIVAGRTSSAFTALIGTMKVHEEIDALRTMGVEPTERLVLPRILGLLISLPLLAFLGDIFGIFGSMVMAKAVFEISYMDYISRLRESIELKTYVIGIIKAPVYALIISLVGCFHGYQVEMNADSVGRSTTKSVVQAIFLIIIAEAIFSLIFSWRGI